MRFLAALMLLAGCDALVPAASAPCAPCPASCPDSCLPAGYCAEVRLPFSSVNLARFDEATTVRIAVGDLPPDARVEVDVDASVDLASREGREPWPWWFTWKLDDAFVVDASRVAGTGFPIAVHGAVTRTTAADGTLAATFLALRCQAHGVDTCLTSSGSAFTVRVLDPTPWLTCAR